MFFKIASKDILAVNRQFKNDLNDETLKLGKKLPCDEIIKENLAAYRPFMSQFQNEMTPEMFALKQLGVPLEFNHVQQNQRVAKQAALQKGDHRSIFASEPGAKASKKVASKAQANLNNSSLKSSKPPAGKADKKRAANYESKVEVEKDMNADLEDGVDYTKSKSPINSKYQLAKLRA